MNLNDMMLNYLIFQSDFSFRLTLFYIVFKHEKAHISVSSLGWKASAYFSSEHLLQIQ